MMVFYFLFSQTPGITWQQTIGGENDDLPSFSLKTIDGQIITIGTTKSLTGVYSGNHGSSDIWVEKHDLKGILQWRKIFGGTGTDLPVNYYYNIDGSLMILATTTSNNGNVSSNHGLHDIWVLKLDNAGTLVWQKCYGGSNDENAGNIIKASDGNFVVSGTTYSSNGDLTANAGNQDAWIFKIDNFGVIQWQKNLGGSNQEGSNNIKVIEASDASIYLLTETASNNGDVSGNHGGNDLWLVKLSAGGVVQWQKCLGGGGSYEYSVEVKETATGDIYVLGNTNSAFPSFHGYTDFYVSRVSSLGAMLWEKCFGGTLDDIPLQIVSIQSDDSFILSGYVNNGGGDVVGYQGNAVGSSSWIVKISGIGDIQWQNVLNHSMMNGHAQDGQWGTGGVMQTSDNGYFITAFTESGNGKTNFHTPTVFDSSHADVWIVKLSSSGTVDWERCFGGYRGELSRGLAVELGNNDFIITACANSNNGDININYGEWDTWLIRLGPVNRIKGTIFLDNNLNGLKDTGEPYYSNVAVKSKKIDSVISVPYGGLFINEVDTGTYATTVSLSLPYYNVVPSSVSSSFTTYFNTDSISFALQPFANKQDLTVSIIPTIAARPGFSSTYRVFYKNVGTTTISSGEILFKKDNRATFVSSSPTIASSNSDTLKWNYSNFAPGDTASIFLTLQVATPPTVNVGDTLSYMAIITPVAADETPSNDTAILKQRVVGAIDPNDKTENNGGVVSSSFIANGNYLQYTVRFQNTGTADAINVVVRDTLGNRVDLNTLEVVTASHPYTLSIENGNQLVWAFNNILLPASSVDEPGSHGYIVYRIRPKTDVVVGETIHNTASIYFDYNLPVLTNDATTLIQDNFSPLPIQLISFTGLLNNNIVQLKWKVNDAKNFERFEIERSIDGRIYYGIGNVTFNSSIADYTSQDNISTLQSNHIFYRLKLVDADGKFTYSRIIAFNINAVQNNFIVYPNPAKTEMYVSITTNRNESLHLKIIDALGRIISDQQKEIQKGNNVFPVNISKMKTGNYILQFILNGEAKTSKFAIIN
jgi:uncharacterized repeat protein (TIGR01451 family)